MNINLLPHNLSQILLAGGIVGPLLYLLHDVVGSFVFSDFSVIENTVSDLTNSAARRSYPLGVVLLTLSALMGIGFGVGILTKFPRRVNKALSAVGAMLVSIGILNIFAATLFPQDPIGDPSTFNGVMHLIIVGIEAFLAVGILWLAGFKAERTRTISPFRRFSAVTIALLVLGGAVTGIVAAQAWPVLGLVERLSVYSFQLWTVIFAIRLILDNSGTNACR